MKDKQQETEKTELRYLNRQLLFAAHNSEQWLEFYQKQAPFFARFPLEEQTVLTRLADQASQVKEHQTAYLQFLTQARGQKPLDSPFLLTPFLDELLSHFRPWLEQKGMKLSLLEAFEGELFGSASLLWSVLYLGLDHMIRSATGPDLDLSVKRVEQFCWFEWRNQSAGLSQKQLNQLRLPDCWGEPPAHLAGLELMLSLAQSAGMAWEISVEPSQGCCLRLGYPSAGSKLKRSPTSVQQGSLEKPKLLVIDSDPHRLGLISALLKSSFHLTSVLGGEQGRQIFRTQSFDALVSNLDLPDFDGADLLFEVRQSYSYGELPVVLFCEAESYPDSLGFLELGANTLLPLPLDPVIFEPTLRGLIAQKRQHQKALSKAVEPARGDGWTETSLFALFDKLKLRLTVMRASGEVFFGEGQKGETLPLAPKKPWTELFPLTFLCQQLQENPKLKGVALQAWVQGEGGATELQWLVSSFEGFFLIRSPEGQETSFEPHTHLEELQGYQLPFVEWQDFAHWPTLTLLEPLHVSVKGPESDPNQRQKTSVRQAQMVVDLMSSCVAVWRRSTGGSKVDLALHSGIWTVHQDKQGTKRAKTLERYLGVKRLPKRPRIKAVRETACFVINQLEPTHKTRRALASKLEAFDRLWGL